MERMNIPAQLADELKLLRQHAGVSRATAERTPLFRALANHLRIGYVQLLRQWTNEFVTDASAQTALFFAFNMQGENYIGDKLHVRRTKACAAMSQNQAALIKLENDGIAEIAAKVEIENRNFLQAFAAREYPVPPEPLAPFALVTTVAEVFELMDDVLAHATQHMASYQCEMDKLAALKERAEELLGFTP